MKSTKVLNPWCFLLLVLSNKAKTQEEKIVFVISYHIHKKASDN